MTSTALISVVFAGALPAIGFACWTLVIRLIRRPKPYRPAPAASAAPPVAALSHTPAAASSQRLPYTRVAHVLTPAEGDFFAVLQAATPTGHQIFAQVRLAGLVHVQPWARRDKSHWWRIQAKCVDFVLVDAATFAPRLVVELDDSSHHRAARRERDAHCRAVGRVRAEGRWWR
jgi:hypothetical protein